MPMTSSICCLTRANIGGGQIDLVEDGDDFVVGIEGVVDIGQRLRLDALGGIDDEQRAFDGGHGAARLRRRSRRGRGCR